MVSSKAMHQTIRKRERSDLSSDEDDGSPSLKQLRNRRGRNPAPIYDWNTDDPDFQASHTSLSETSQQSETFGSASFPRRGRGRPPKGNTVNSTVGPIDVDINLFCDECAKYYEGDCLVHGTLTIIKDISVPRKVKNETRARKTAPLEVRVADAKSAGGVWAKKFISARTLFGPYRGQVVSKDVGGGTFIWEIKKNGSVVHCIDASDPGLSNWMRYVNRARCDGEQNLNAYQYQGEIYFRTIKDVGAREELVVFDGYTHGRQSGTNTDNKSTNATVVNKSFKCPGCNIAYISQDYVDRHVKTCRQLRQNDCAGQIFKCMGCQCAYSSAEYLERHKKVCRKSEPSITSAQMFKCPGCKCAYATEDYLERHKRICKELGSRKVPREVFPCPGCKCAYSTAEYLDRHKKICRQLELQKPAEETYKCCACQSAYADFKYLERHKKICRQPNMIKAPDAPTKYECSQCHSVYTDKMFLERHKKNCEGTENKNLNEKPSFECLGCHSVYGNLEFLHRHKLNCSELNSSKPSELKCSTCPRTFADQTLLNRHKMKCEKISSCLRDALNEEEEVDRIFDEDSEDKMSQTPVNLAKREKEKSFVCSVEMQVPFVSLERIAWFDPLLHETALFDVPSLKPLKCPDCNEQFTYRARMENHRLLHLGQTLNVCVECDMAFYNKTLYSEHVESHC